MGSITKNNSWLRKLVLFLLVSTLLLNTGCGGIVQVYDGSPLPSRYVAFLRGNFKTGYTVRADTVDGKGGSADWFEVLPGKHTVTFTAYAHMIQYQYSVYTGSLEFYAQEGHVYILKADTFSGGILRDVTVEDITNDLRGARLEKDAEDVLHSRIIK